MTHGQSPLDLRALERIGWTEWERDAALGYIRVLRATLQEAKRTHLVVEDCWYSCPKALDEKGRSACCNDAINDASCNCGADEHNAKIAAVLAQATDEEQGLARQHNTSEQSDSEAE